ncbi:hypothetical protein F4780DRAFT_280835 [Xylariomycetidae sp. FL0641]|nr:hypothetical protein F4780DRAFT_280835 [Xylariomycetidae sp. FL0641]
MVTRFAGVGWLATGRPRRAPVHHPRPPATPLLGGTQGTPLVPPSAHLPSLVARFIFVQCSSSKHVHRIAATLQQPATQPSVPCKHVCIIQSHLAHPPCRCRRACRRSAPKEEGCGSPDDLQPKLSRAGGLLLNFRLPGSLPARWITASGTTHQFASHYAISYCPSRLPQCWISLEYCPGEPIVPVQWEFRPRLAQVPPSLRYKPSKPSYATPFGQIHSLYLAYRCRRRPRVLQEQCRRARRAKPLLARPPVEVGRRANLTFKHQVSSFTSRVFSALPRA